MSNLGTPAILASVPSPDSEDLGDVRRELRSLERRLIGAQMNLESLYDELARVLVQSIPEKPLPEATNDPMTELGHVVRVQVIRIEVLDDLIQNMRERLSI